MINTLKHLTEVNGKKIMSDSMRPMNGAGETDWAAFDEMRNEFPICIDHEQDMISVKMLTKPASEGGNMALCQWSDLVTLGLEQLKYLNEKFPCRENAIAITHFETGLMWNDKRTSDRIKRNVEGKDKL